MSRKEATRIQSMEPMILLSASAADIEGTDAGEWLNGTDADNNIFAGGGNDDIYAPAGDNFIDGGDGQDTLVIYEGTEADYHVTKSADGTVTVEGPGANGGTVKNTMVNVERINFTDGFVNVVDLDGDTTNGGSNVDPLAVDDEFTTSKNESLWGSVLVNDDDANGDALTVSLKSGPSNGSLSLNSDGGFDYIPDSGFVGHDSFEYTVDDGNGGTDHATVTIWVNGDDADNGDDGPNDDDQQDPDNDDGKDDDGGKDGKSGLLKNLIWKKVSLLKKVKDTKLNLLKNLVSKKKDVVEDIASKKTFLLKGLVSKKSSLLSKVVSKKTSFFGSLFGRKSSSKRWW